MSTTLSLFQAAQEQHAMILAADPPATGPDGAGFKDWILLIAGNIFIIVLAVRSVHYYAARQWGELVGHIIGGIVVAGLVYANDASITLLKKLFNLFIG